MKPGHPDGGTAPRSMPTFVEFYRAINQRDPFPWQSRLANQVATTEQWPAEVGVPTGLGKTACLDIAVWWLASQAERTPAERTAPTRIWWVVNRRLLVDSTAEHADEKIANVLSDPDLAGERREVVATVAHRLRTLAADPGAVPLEVIRLRGGIASHTPTDPSQPTVLLCTVPMYGSRLLFRGYGSSHGGRAVDAAMAGTDSLILLDEAHLAPHLKVLSDALAECTPDAQSILGKTRSRTTMVALTATGNAAVGQRFDLDTEDEAHSIVRQRLDAVKPLELRIETGDVGRRLAEATLHLIREAPAPAACVVFANSPKTRARGVRPPAKADSGDRGAALDWARTRAGGGTDTHADPRSKPRHGRDSRHEGRSSASSHRGRDTDPGSGCGYRRGIPGHGGMQRPCAHAAIGPTKSPRTIHACARRLRSSAATQEVARGQDYQHGCGHLAGLRDGAQERTQ